MRIRRLRPAVTRAMRCATWYVALFATSCIVSFVSFGTPRPAWAAIQSDPLALYQTMHKAFAQSSTQGWSFRNEMYYLATIVDAGRAYSLFRPADPAYAELAFLTVSVGARLHYNPLTNDFAAPWYIREAASYVMAHGTSQQVEAAKALLRRANAVDAPLVEALLADEDATANVEAFPGDRDAAIDQVLADWRGYVVTKDVSYRALAFERAAAAAFPIGALPNPWGNDLLEAARTAAAGARGYSAVEVASAQVLLAHLRAVHPLPVIATVTARSHDAYLTTLAPADEYFGRSGMSVLGMKNEIRRIGALLDAGYGVRESGGVSALADAVDDLHRIYPKDRELPTFLLDTYELASRIHTREARRSATHMRAVLTIEYSDTLEAQRLLSAGPQ